MVIKRGSKRQPLVNYLVTEQLSAQSSENKTMALLGRTRSEQMEQISSASQQQEAVDAAKKTNRLLTLSISSMVLAAVGAAGYPLLTLLSVAGVVYVSRDAFIDSIQLFLNKRQVNVDTLSTITRVMLLATGNFFFAGWGILNYAINQKLMTKIKSDSKKSLIDVFRQQPRSVWVLTNEAEVEIPFQNLRQGDIVVVNAGGIIPVDGTVIEGTALVDQNILTGESQPVEKEIGDPLLALTVVLSGRICVQVEKTGEETTAAQIAHIYSQTADAKLDVQLQAETMSNRTIMPTLMVSGLCLPILGSTQALAILAGHFKYKGTIVTSLAVLNTLNLVSEKGILIKDGRTLELLNQVDSVVFDKTGTLTQKEPQVGYIYHDDGYSEDDVVLYAAIAESRQTHPIAKAILQEANQRSLKVPQVDEVDYTIGLGLKVNLDGQCLYVGSARFMEKERLTISTDLLETQDYSHSQGYSLVFVALNDQIIGAIELCPTLRSGAINIVNTLKQRGIKNIYIISGDHEVPTKKITQELGIDDYFAEALPEDKAALIDQLQSEGKKVCYVGDGINDIIALQKATVSISLSGATTAAIDTAQIVLMDENLEHLSYLFDISKQLKTNIRTTFALVLGSSILTMGGALFLNFGLATAYILPQLGLMAGIANSMWPLLPHNHDMLEKK